MKTPSLAALLLATTFAAPALADSPRTPLLPAYVQECGACHVAFPPGLLAAATWQRQMAGLKQHYGSDASLDAATQAPIAAWLQANAGSGKRVEAAPPEDRITLGRWFQREHDEVSAATWQRASIKRMSNCAACHTKAADGSYREREIHIPAK